MSTGRKLGAIAATLIMGPWAGIQADIVYSTENTIQSEPSTILAEKSISCDNADAVIFVNPGYGIQNADLTAAKIVPIANEHNMCIRFVTYGTTADINVLADKEAEVLRSSRRAQRAADPTLKPNVIEIGESLGGIIAAQVRNRLVEKYGNEFSYPAIIDDATPSGSEAVRWGNPTIAEMVARNCQWFKLGDMAMTIITVLTDPDDERRSQLFDPKHGAAYFWQVYEATKGASMQLRLHESCIVGAGMPPVDQTMDQTTVLYAYADHDPIVNGGIAKDVMEEKANGYFEEVHMTSANIDGHHADAWGDWEAYEPYYRYMLDRCMEIIEQRERILYVPRGGRGPHIYQPR
jgi:hypothetical protein